MTTRDSQAAYFGGGGRFASIGGGAVAAGNEILFVVPANRRWRIVALVIGFTTDATVATRTVGVRLLEPGGAVAWRGPAINDQTASQALSYTASAAPSGGSSLNADEYIPLPPGLMAGPGWAIVTTTRLLQPGDQFTDNPRILVEEWADE